MTTCTTLDLGDGITQSTDFADGRCEVVFLVDGDIVATSYVDDEFAPRVDFSERLSLDGVDFKRTVTVFGLAWIKANQLAVKLRASGPAFEQGDSHA